MLLHRPTGSARIPKAVLLARFQAFSRGDWASLLQDATDPEQAAGLRKDILSYKRVKVRQGCSVAQPGVSAGIASVGRCIRPGLMVSFARGAGVLELLELESEVLELGDALGGPRCRGFRALGP